MKKDQIEELRAAFFAKLKEEQEKSGVESKPAKVARKPKPVEDAPFTSDDDEDDNAKIKDVPKVKPTPKTIAEDPFASSDEDETKGKPAAKAQKGASKRKKEDEDEERLRRHRRSDEMFFISFQRFHAVV